MLVFTKIPKNSIRIPIIGGKTYSPDFAYVLNFKNGQKRLYFVVETKNTGDVKELKEIERQKIKHAEKIFGGAMKMKFETQFSKQKMQDLIQKIYC